MRAIREATPEELAYRYRTYLDRTRVSFRHFTMELYAPNSKNGVQHREYSAAKPRMVDGKMIVTHHGKPHELTATVYELTVDGATSEIISDLRIKSEYLP
jgi:hypothetical protein